MSTLLLIETGTEVCSVAVAREGRLMALLESAGDEPGRGEHAQRLGPYIDQVLKESGVTASELDAVAVGAGPGSYTGLRIGVSTAKGLCYGLRKPLIAVDSLRALANTALQTLGTLGTSGALDPAACLAPMVDARRMEVYTRLFDPGLNPLTQTQAHVLTPESFAEIRQAGQELIVFGNGARKAAALLPWARYVEVSASARGMATLAQEQYNGQDFVDVAYFEPLYLKEFVAVKGSTALEKLSAQKPRPQSV